MVYHEIRIIDGKKQNYLVYNKRKAERWIKKSKFIGNGNIPNDRINKLKDEFEIETIASLKYPYLNKEQAKEIEKLKKEYNKKIGSLSKEEYKGELSEGFILRLHAIILKDISEKFAGRYRENPVRIFGSDARFPDSAVVPQLVKNLIYWYHKHKKDYHPFERAIIFSMKLVTIHPFVEGNGRISRLIMNFILRKKDYPWINIYNKKFKRKFKKF